MQFVGNISTQGSIHIVCTYNYSFASYVLNYPDTCNVLTCSFSCTYNVITPIYM